MLFDIWSQISSMLLGISDERYAANCRISGRVYSTGCWMSIQRQSSDCWISDNRYASFSISDWRYSAGCWISGQRYAGGSWISSKKDTWQIQPHISVVTKEWCPIYGVSVHGSVGADVWCDKTALLRDTIKWKFCYVYKGYANPPPCWTILLS